MRRLKWLLLLFCLALAAPLGWFVWRTEQGLRQQERAEFTYFAEALLDRLQGELAELVRQEEARGVDQYHRLVRGPSGLTLSPLAGPPAAPYIVGYLQNNPDGSFTTPLAEPGSLADMGNLPTLARLAAVNRAFNAVRLELGGPAPLAQAAPDAGAAPGADGRAGERADNRANGQAGPPPGPTPGAAPEASPNIPNDQAPPDQAAPDQSPQEGRLLFSERYFELRIVGRPDTLGQQAPRVEELPESLARRMGPGDEDDRRVELAPLQAVILAPDTALLFRRVVLGRKVLRQGLALDLPGLLRHLADAHFAGQPMAKFARLTLTADTSGTLSEVSGPDGTNGPEPGPLTIGAGADAPDPVLSLTRTLPRPFAFLTARIDAASLPPAEGRDTLRVMLGVLAAVIGLGLLAIYRSVGAQVELSRRRSQFVSSVTHELKTPLTTIRMYAEMLREGMAEDPERRAGYLATLDSEAGRLSRLIDSVLEFSSLEHRRRTFNPQPGDLGEVLDQVLRAMDAQARQAGFELTAGRDPEAKALYDREALVQMLVNLVENSLKFGAGAPEKRVTLTVRRHRGRVLVEVSDTGPGIPPRALKRIFDDFYRAEEGLARETKGTGLGLALVRRLARAQGARVWAANNKAAGCTITIALRAAR